jgi:YD repeat-containing protein
MRRHCDSTTRTTTTTFDAAARPATVTVIATGLGTAPSAQTLNYDPTTGAPLTVSAGGKSITTTMDQLGRQLTYTDGTGLQTANQYDNLDRVTKSTQSDAATGGLTRTFDTTSTYDANTSRATSQADTQSGTTTLGYDTAGNLTTQTQSSAPGSLTVTSSFDPTGDQVTKSWTMTGQSTPVLTESVVSNIHGQQSDHTMMPGGHRDYRYDSTGRLTSVTDLDAAQCATRAYRFDANSNRTGFSSSSAAATADGAGNLTVCPAPTTPTASTTYDTGDRDTTTGTSYDAFGRTTRLPMTGGQVMRVAYQANDLVASQTLYATAADADANSGAGTNPIDASTYTLDVTGQRISTRTAGVSSPVTKMLRYADSSDSPAWTDEGDGTITRTIAGPGGDLAATAVITKAGTAANDQLTWQLADLHGDIAATLPTDASAPLQISRPDEYGASSAEQPRYGWLGAKQRAGDTPAGIVLLAPPNQHRFVEGEPRFVLLPR